MNYRQHLTEKGYDEYDVEDIREEYLQKNGIWSISDMTRKELKAFEEYIRSLPKNGQTN